MAFQMASRLQVEEKQTYKEQKYDMINITQTMETVFILFHMFSGEVGTRGIENNFFN